MAAELTKRQVVELIQQSELVGDATREVEKPPLESEMIGIVAELIGSENVTSKIPAPAARV
ncbi:MAG: hypothetical protein BWY66_00260 [bacterium ADurb.Bin374]|nr:MAG: hypothetical protein BWY66_00260 [bacterium ADurb.Bin374]